MEAVKKYFDENPDATICYSALGWASGDKEALQKRTAGTGALVLSHTREGVKHEHKSDEIKFAIADQENKVVEAQSRYEASERIYKVQTMAAWVKAKSELEKMKTSLSAQLTEEAKNEKENQKAETAEPIE